jgi:5'(3')-deoxyribonucleotidase
MQSATRGRPTGDPARTGRQGWANPRSTPPNDRRLAQASRLRQGGDHLTIAVDFDGVLFDHVPHVLRGFRDRHGIDLTDENLQYWDFQNYDAVQASDLTEECVRALLDRIETDPALHSRPPKDPRAARVIAGWVQAGHRVDVVTARGEISREVTERFLQVNGIPHEQLVMEAGTKTGYDVLVDDAPHNVHAAADDGSLALLMDQPYNQDVRAVSNPARVQDWLDVSRAVPIEVPTGWRPA